LKGNGTSVKKRGRPGLNATPDFREWAEAIAEMAAGPFLVLDDGLRVIAASPAFYDAFDLTPAEAEHRSVFELRGGEWDTPELRAALSENAANGVPRRFEFARKFAADDRLLSVQVRSLGAGNEGRIVLIAIDGAFPGRSSQFDRDARVEAVPHAPGVVHADPEGRPLRLDARAAQICGVAEGAAGAAEWLRHAEAEDLPALEAAVRRARSAGAAASAEVRFRVPGRDAACVQLIAAPGASGLVFVLEDVSPQKALERRLEHAWKVQTIGRLVGGVAHDFNNVLAAISSYSAQVLCLVPPSSAALKPAVRISKLVDQAALITRQLLAFSRRQPLHARSLNLNHLLRDMNDLLFRTLGSGIEIKLDLDLCISPVLVDMGQMQQVILNLAVNARDAMLQGGTLSFTTGNVALDGAAAIHGLPAGDYVLLEVRDTGVGLAPGTREQIFEPFFTTKPSGTGFGLAMVRHIIEQSGGTIEVHSESGHGTSFRIYLPRTGAPEAQLESPGGTETILLVDDVTAVRALVREVLEGRGYTVVEASDALQALNLAAAYHRAIDLLLTDLLIPGMSGHELARRLRESRRCSKVIYMSGNPIDLARASPVTGHFLDKPFRPETLVAMVRKVLDLPKTSA
jgi:two-component system, cell cycle sensor histidine kinase and response regulator CckA